MPANITINGQPISISHLDKITRRMTLDLAGGKQKKNAFLEFRFSCHCYSREPNENEQIPGGMRVPDGSQEHPRDRIFDQTRYSLSLSLPQLIDDLINNNRDVTKTKKQNIFATTMIVQNANGIGQDVLYYVFMKPKKKQDPNQPPKLDIFIESAHLRDNPRIPAPSQEGAPCPFSEMLGRVWENKF